MKILQGNELLDTLMYLSKPQTEQLNHLGITQDQLHRYYREIVATALPKEEVASFLSVSKDMRALDGVDVILGHDTINRVVANAHGLPVNEVVLGAMVIPGPTERKLMMVNVEVFYEEPETSRSILEHEIVHLEQIDRGDLILEHDGTIVWNGWNPMTMSAMEVAKNALSGLEGRDYISEEILTKPWETEAYALTTPMKLWKDVLSERAMEHIADHCHLFCG